MLRKLPIDTYMLLLIGTVILASLLPVSGEAARLVSNACYAAVALLFFLYGAKLKTTAVWDGMSNWRLQGLIFLATYLVFPLLGLGMSLALKGVLSADLRMGILFLSILPSTVQSSIALTALAQGNVSAAICAASFSNAVGVVITPLLATLLLSSAMIEIGSGAALSISLQILLPFVLGQLLRPWLGAAIERHRLLTMIVDRGSILLIIYSAFSAGVVAGIWGRIDTMSLSMLIAADIVLLIATMSLITIVGRSVGLPAGDRVTFLFCGAQKSLAAGVPIANILFEGQATSLIILPLMLYHQFQLFAAVAIAQRRASQIVQTT
jgi:sodium/bile acid cotransporter 7